MNNSEQENQNQKQENNPIKKQNYSYFYSSEQTLEGKPTFKKILGQIWKYTKYVIFAFLLVTTIWGCVNGFVLRTSYQTGQGFEIYADWDESKSTDNIYPNAYAANFKTKFSQLISEPNPQSYYTLNSDETSYDFNLDSYNEAFIEYNDLLLTEGYTGLPIDPSTSALDESINGSKYQYLFVPSDAALSDGSIGGNDPTGTNPYQIDYGKHWTNDGTTDGTGAIQMDEAQYYDLESLYLKPTIDITDDSIAYNNGFLKNSAINPIFSNEYAYQMGLGYSMISTPVYAKDPDTGDIVYATDEEGAYIGAGQYGYFPAYVYHKTLPAQIQLGDLPGDNTLWYGPAPGNLDYSPSLGRVPTYLDLLPYAGEDVNHNSVLDEGEDIGIDIDYDGKIDTGIADGILEDDADNRYIERTRNAYLSDNYNFLRRYSMLLMTPSTTKIIYYHDNPATTDVNEEYYLSAQKALYAVDPDTGKAYSPNNPDFDYVTYPETYDVSKYPGDNQAYSDAYISDYDPAVANVPLDLTQEYLDEEITLEINEEMITNPFTGNPTNQDNIFTWSPRFNITGQGTAGDVFMTSYSQTHLYRSQSKDSEGNVIEGEYDLSEYPYVSIETYSEIFELHNSINVVEGDNSHLNNANNTGIATSVPLFETTSLPAGAPSDSSILMFSSIEVTPISKSNKINLSPAALESSEDFRTTEYGTNWKEENSGSSITNASDYDKDNPYTTGNNSLVSKAGFTFVQNNTGSGANDELLSAYPSISATEEEILFWTSLDEFNTWLANPSSTDYYIDQIPQTSGLPTGGLYTTELYWNTQILPSLDSPLDPIDLNNDASIGVSITDSSLADANQDVILTSEMIDQWVETLNLRTLIRWVNGQSTSYNDQITSTSDLEKTVGKQNSYTNRAIITTWGDAWSPFGPFIGLFVFPIAMVAYAFNSIGFLSVDNIGGWGVFLGIMFIVLLLRSLAMALSFKQNRQTQKIQDVQVKVASINAKYEKYKDNKDMKRRKQMEIMALYKREEINPLGAFSTIVITMPIFLAIWKIISALPIYKQHKIGPLDTTISPLAGIFAGGWTFFLYGYLLLLVIFTQFISFKLGGWLSLKRRNVKRMDEETLKQYKKNARIANWMLVFYVIMSITIPTLLAIYWVMSGLFTILSTWIQHWITILHSKKRKSKVKSYA